MALGCVLIKIFVGKSVDIFIELLIGDKVAIFCDIATKGVLIYGLGLCAKLTYEVIGEHLLKRFLGELHSCKLMVAEGLKRFIGGKVAVNSVAEPDARFKMGSKVHICAENDSVLILGEEILKVFTSFVKADIHFTAWGNIHTEIGIFLKHFFKLLGIFGAEEEMGKAKIKAWMLIKNIVNLLIKVSV